VCVWTVTGLAPLRPWEEGACYSEGYSGPTAAQLEPLLSDLSTELRESRRAALLLYQCWGCGSGLAGRSIHTDCGTERGECAVSETVTVWEAGLYVDGWYGHYSTARALVRAITELGWEEPEAVDCAARY
jgi:hypothetical protein